MDEQAFYDRVEDNYEDIKSSLIVKHKPGYAYYFGKNDQEFIEELVDQANASEQEAYYIWPVARVKDPRALIRMGFFPTSVNISLKWFVDWYYGTDLESLEFWWSPWYEDVKKYLTNLTRESRWVYYSIDTWKRWASASALSVGLRILANETLYKSMRPKTDMGIFRTTISWRTDKEDIVKGQMNPDKMFYIDPQTEKKVFSKERWLTIPVTRYSGGMSRGLFFEESKNKEFCGTFYYHEPESSTYLAYQTSHRSFNKYTAMKELLKIFERNDSKIMEHIKNTPRKNLTEEFVYYKDYIEGIHEEDLQDVRLYSEGALPANLMMTPEEASKYQRSSDKDIDPASLPQVKYYCPESFHLYAAEDMFDQPLCLLCKRLKIDILVLKNMIGSFQVVTEILDARDRKESFKSLLYTN